MQVVVGLAVAVALVVVASEVAHWHASRQRPAPGGPGQHSTAVIVLGYGSRGRGLHPVQRWRTDIAARTLRAAGDGCLIFSGSAKRQGSGRTEADVMAAYATSRLGVRSDQVRLEPRATSTWENLQLSLAMAEAYDRIAIASDPLHASRAARYAAAQRPDLASRLVGARAYRPLERWWLKVPTAAYECAMVLRAWRRSRRLS